MQRRFDWRYFVVALVLLLVIIYFTTGVGSYLTLASLKQNRDALVTYFTNYPIAVSLGFGFIYIVTTALSIPGATVLTLAAGAIFGVFYGTIIASLASTVGATLSFLGARYLFRESAEKKFHERMIAINQGIQKEGSFYLFTLRLIPIFPFFLVNLVMGLTNFPALRFFLISQLGMLPGTLVYVNAGTELSKIETLRGILSPGLLLSFALLGMMPLVSKWMVSYFRSRKHLRNYKKPKKFDYNMIVIGGGSAGLVSAYIASAVKAKVALIEKHKMGGDCLNTGCVPSKALIRSAKIFNYFRRANEFGLETTTNPQINFSKVMERVQRVIHEIEPHDSIERYTQLGVECVTGEAKIISPYEVQVNGQILTTKNIVIATGARPLVPKIPGLELVNPLTSDTIWNLRERPSKLVVLGGGPIGCELAQSFARLGSHVTLVEMSNRIMIREDEDVSDVVTTSFKSEGVRILTSHKALRIEKNENGARLICECSGQEVVIEFDQILLALGRRANVTGFGLEELGVEISNRGTVVANEFLQTTNFPNIYTCGDVTGPYQFTHTAAHQAWYVAVNALFSPFKSFKVDYRVIPWCTFSDPEVARVGLNEAEANEKGIKYHVTKYGIDDLDRAIADSEAHGFVKVLTVPGRDKILGVTIVGHHAGDIISEYVTAMKYGLGLNKILGTIHIYPTLSEANKYAAGVWKKQNAPQFALRILKQFHDWRRQ
ncbi:MAG: dihydrolipoyl dehydrogenase [Bdellovibrionales bacterium RIFCSPHIGHO2_01_FULL_40_29]|nr:MAG: dihydrolipoyl dehydrogenase [Bdellovibrionales bacterium RIFCSPHIGHO2_01_FULL_40_29]OFZ33546.1 MAG: dihydrolipoyl dehydrogenase [Bdellovibrionales bacterium RIFCSPHIGHO2_02_FULL_40_15]